MKRELKVDVVINIFLVEMECISIIHHCIAMQNIKLLRKYFNGKLFLFEHGKCPIGFFLEDIDTEVGFNVHFNLVLVGPDGSSAGDSGLLCFQLIVVSQLNASKVGRSSC